MVFGQPSNLPDVMSAMPGIHAECVGQRYCLIRLRMKIRKGILTVGHRVKESCPAIMDPVEDLQRRLEGCQTGIRQFRPIPFVIRFDRRRLFGQRQSKSDVAIGVAVRQMVNDLPHRPVSILSVQHRLRKSRHGFSQLGRRHCDDFDECPSSIGPQVRFEHMFADWVLRSVHEEFQCDVLSKNHEQILAARSFRSPSTAHDKIV